jgi:hypothetical protein
MEAWLYSHGHADTPDCNTENPHLTHKVALRDVKGGVSQALRARMITDPVFYVHTITSKGYRGGQNNGNTKKRRNRICIGYTARTSVGNTEYSSSIYLHSVVLVSVYW